MAGQKAAETLESAENHRDFSCWGRRKSCPEGEITDFWFGGQPEVAHDMGKRETQHYSKPIY